MTAPNGSKGIGGGKRVLVVNDTQEILELFADLLGELGFEVSLMSFAPRELQRIREVRPDLIILDFVFGQRELLGWQLLQKLKMDRGLDSVPVIVCTAAQREVAEQEGYLTEQGVIVVLKPFNVDQLEEAVTRALDIGDSAVGLNRPRATLDGTWGDVSAEQQARHKDP
ncbi:MAG TPA: response regulator [Candidatus Limnocylindria bacterium]|jgi:CheY-like chemotaxis protein|nr:response regulator [Candidatus Limnocylindria bacterium]